MIDEATELHIHDAYRAQAPRTAADERADVVAYMGLMADGLMGPLPMPPEHHLHNAQNRAAAVSSLLTTSSRIQKGDHVGAAGIVANAAAAAVGRPDGKGAP